MFKRNFASAATAAALGLALLAPVSAFSAESSALLKVLVKKGVLTQKEALNIEAEAQEEQAAQEKLQKNNTGALKINDWVDELKLYGDIRSRYQYDNRDYQVDPLPLHADDRSPSGTQRSRWRFRLRLNADFKLKGDWFGGVELQTGYAADSANATYETGFADSPIFISKAFLGKNFTDGLTAIIGKQPNPFYTTDMVWDPDINPAGLVEKVAFHKLWGSHGDASTTTLDKDGKTVVAKDVTPFNSPWELTLVAGQFIFSDNLEGGGRDPGVTDNDSTTDTYLFETQLQASYKFNKDVKVTIAPAWMIYSAGTISQASAVQAVYGDYNDNYFSDSSTVSGASRHLNIIDVPGDISFKLFGVKSKVMWDFAYNIEGKPRANDIYRLVSQVHTPNDPDDFRSNYRSEDSIAWLAGFQIGENKKKGDWSLLANYRRTGIASVDPNLNDNDFALGELNVQGFKVALAYNLADYAEFRATWMQAWNLRKNLTGGEATSGNSIADSNANQVLQVDLTVKF